MKRNEFLKIAMGLTGTALLGLHKSEARVLTRNKVPVGGHVWVYAKDQPGFDVSPVLPRIFSDMKYAGLDGVETMEHPLRKEETTRLIGELIEEYHIPLLGSSYGADMWDRSKHNEIIEDLHNLGSE